MIQVQNLGKDYGQFCAVDNISFTIPQGEIVGFLGPNGAGKTTTLKMITGFMPPTRGDVFFNNESMQENARSIRKKIGYLPEGCPLYPEMNVVDYLRFVAALREIPSAQISQHVESMICACGLSAVVHKEIGELSKGYRQRVGLAGALIHDPEYLIMDEPTTGLDPNQIVEIRALIKQLGIQKTVLLSTHILQEVEATCDRVIIIDRGRIVADGALSDLRNASDTQQRISLEVRTDDQDIVSKLQTIPAVTSVQIYDTKPEYYKLYVQYEKNIDVRPDIYHYIKNTPWTLLEMHSEQQSLEDVFRQLTDTMSEDNHE